MKNRSGFQVMTRLIGLVKPLGGYMSLAVLMGLIGHLCAAFLTVFGGYGLMMAAKGVEPSSFAILFVVLAVMALMRGVLRYGEQACNHFIAFKLLALLRDRVFRALRRLCPAKLEGKEKGNLIAVITSDIELLEVFYAHTISPVLIAVLFTIILCLFIGSFYWALGLLALVAYGVVGILIPLIISKMSGQDGFSFRTQSGKLSSFVLDSLQGLTEILQYGQGKNRLAQMNEQTDKLAKEEEKMKRMAGRNAAITGFTVLFFDLCMLFIALFLCQQGMIEAEGVWLSTLALFSSFGPVSALAALGSTLQSTFAAGNRVLDLLDESPVVQDITGQSFVSFSGAGADHVTFSYGDDKVLDDVSVRVPEKSIIGIVGKSGSGKSTLLKLFMRFWDTQNGHVRVSSIDVKDINTKNLRDMESFVTQDTHLFHDSIKNNLRIARLHATDRQIEEACRKASIHDFILSLPKGYDTPVGELGDTLSGGERQRLGLARAFLHDAPFLLLDEPTSNLDSLNEAVILKALREERQGKTVVLVSHRPSTMRVADTVYSVENGRMS